MDLLEHAQTLVARGQTNSQTQAHTAYLQSIVQPETPVKVQTKTKANNSQIPTKNPNTNNYLLVGGLFLLLGSVLAIGYWLGKRKPKNKLYFDEN